MDKKGLTLTMVVDAASANYGESIGNISQLKKMTRQGGEVYTYISRQAIRYNIVQQMGIDDTPVKIGSDNNSGNKKGVAQFDLSAKIDEYPEIDLFGYMKTIPSKNKNEKKGTQETRSAVVRLSNAISLEPYNMDNDFGNNMGLAQRIGQSGNMVLQSEIHKSLYCYTVTCDLDKVGIDEKAKIEISNDEKASRVVSLLETLEFLYRDIKGRRENLNPVFAVGGVYDRKNPYFEDRIKTYNQKLNVELINSIINSCDDTKNNTVVGVLPGIFANDDEIKTQLTVMSIADVFSQLKKKVKAYYA